MKQHMSYHSDPSDWHMLRRNEIKIMKKNIFTNTHTFKLRDVLLNMTYK